MRQESGSSKAIFAALGGQGVRSDINVTPLVDVCLVLLIIFMVVTPLLQTGVDVALPSTTKPEKIPESSKQLSVAIKQNGDVFIGKDFVPFKDLEARLVEIHTDSPEKVIAVKADKRLKYKEVRKVLAVINDAGFTGVGLITQKREKA
jgi:biopolymer transport protein TolR